MVCMNVRAGRLTRSLPNGEKSDLCEANEANQISEIRQLCRGRYDGTAVARDEN